MTNSEILALYDAERRAVPSVAPGLKYEWTEGVLRVSGAFGFICSWNLSESEVATAIRRQVEFCREIGQEVEWKVYGHDLPRNLAGELEAAGFLPDEQETFLAASQEDLGRHQRQTLDKPLEIRKVQDDAGFDDFYNATFAAFGPPKGDGANEWRANLSEPTRHLYVAYWDGIPVAASRLELPTESQFAGLWGGGTTPEYRSKGIYRALVAERAKVAFGLGYRFVTVDARETSRPILEKLGFRSLTTITGWIFDPGA